jgi:hypothetical protein
MIGKVGDCASEECAWSACEHLPAARIIEGAAREPGKGFEIERQESLATQGRTSKLPEVARDSGATMTRKDVQNVDLDAAQNVVLARWTAADEPDYVVRDRGDQVESVCHL